MLLPVSRLYAPERENAAHALPGGATFTQLAGSWHPRAGRCRFTRWRDRI